MQRKVLKQIGSWPLEAFLIAVSIILLPLKAIFSNLALILFLLVVVARHYNGFKSKSLNLGILVIFLFFGVILAGLFNTPEFATELRIIERRFPLFFVPAVFFLLPKEKQKEIGVYFWEAIFILSIFLSLYSLIMSYLIYQELGYIPVDGPRITEITFIDRPYFGLIIVLSVAYILSLKYKVERINYGRYAVLLLLVFSLIFIVARLALVILGVIIIYFVFFCLHKKKWLNIGSLSLVGLALTASLVAILNYDRFTDRFQYLLEGKGEARILIWRCAYEQAVSKEFSFIFGNKSSALTQEKLIQCYEKEFNNGSYWGWVHEHNNRFNTHNDYLNVFLSYGILGLTLFIMLLYRLFLKSFKQDHLIGQLFVIIFLLNCLTENLLDRQISIFILSIGASVILFFPYEGNDSNIVSQ